MGLQTDLAAWVRKTLKEPWTIRNGSVVPTADTVALGNQAVRLEGCVLYADLSGSTDLVDTKEPQFAALVYKTYLHCAAKLIRESGGQITAYDGDRIMAVFLGSNQCSSAVTAALRINYACLNTVNPLMKQEFPSANYVVRHTVGIDKSMLFVATEGVRGAKDLVWVGRAANYAAKLSDRPSRTVWITSDVFAELPRNLRVTTAGQSCWAEEAWRGIRIYGSDATMQIPD